MGKVDDENQLDEDEEEAARHPEVHPGWAEAAVRDEKGAHPAPDDEEVLQAPEPVLQAGPGITGKVLFLFLADKTVLATGNYPVTPVAYVARQMSFKF